MEESPEEGSRVRMFSILFLRVCHLLWNTWLGTWLPYVCRLSLLQESRSEEELRKLETQINTAKESCIRTEKLIGEAHDEEQRRHLLYELQKQR